MRSPYHLFGRGISFMLTAHIISLYPACKGFSHLMVHLLSLMIENLYRLLLTAWLHMDLMWLLINNPTVQQLVGDCQDCKGRKGELEFIEYPLCAWHFKHIIFFTFTNSWHFIIPVFRHEKPRLKRLHNLYVTRVTNIASGGNGVQTQPPLTLKSVPSTLLCTYPWGCYHSDWTEFSL